MLSPPPPTLVWWYEKRFLTFFWDLVIQEQCLEEVPGSLCETVGAFIPGVWRAFPSAPLSLWRGLCKASTSHSSASSVTPRPMWQGPACPCFLGNCITNGVVRSSRCWACSEANWCLSPMAWPKFWCSVISSFLIGQAWSILFSK